MLRGMAGPELRVTHPPTERPLVIFAGDCRYCRLWVGRWQAQWPGRMDFMPSQEAAVRFPEIPAARYDQAVQFVGLDGVVHAGAAAGVRARAVGLDRRSLLQDAYQRVPLVASIMDRAYRWVADHRPLVYRLTVGLHGQSLVPPRYTVGPEIFLRLLAVVFAIAFASFWWQLRGLIGPDGLLPATPFLDAVTAQLGASRWWRLPTLCWIFGGGWFLHLLCAGGLALSAAAFLGRARAGCFGLLAASYLSLIGAGQLFLSFQWDAFLVECGFLAVFLSAGNAGSDGRREPASLARLLGWWLAFRLLFLSGVVKLTSGDAAWRDLSAMLYHYETQPLPTRFAWWAHQLPEWFQRFSCGTFLAIELVLPFLFFTTQRLRRGAALGQIGLQVLIALTGNYTFFNLLTAALCLLMLDDGWWSRWLGVAPANHSNRGESPARGPGAAALAAAATTFALAAIVVSLPTVWRRPSWPQWYADTFSLIAATRAANPYGLFPVMTKSRQELIVEGSDDGLSWKPYEFTAKPGALDRAPGFVAPHQPRLDWQMWFAALSYPQREPWVARLAEQLLRGSPAVTGLLEANPFPRKPPRLVRVMLYEYHFTDRAERARTGRWWRREAVDFYLRPTALRR